MPPAPGWHAPPGDGQRLADPAPEAAAATIDANRHALDHADGRVDGVPLRHWRAEARQEALAAARDYLRDCGEPVPPDAVNSTVIATGHQPELSHPGVWVKNFALAAQARATGSAALNLVVDNDTLKQARLLLPAWPDDAPSRVRLTRVTYDIGGTGEPYETRLVRDRALFGSFADRVLGHTVNWGTTPVLAKVWPQVVAQDADVPIGERFARARRSAERSMGCHNLELPVSRLAETEGFRRFACHIHNDLARFSDCYNRAIRDYRTRYRVRSAHHPAPELARDDDALEAPFWRITAAGRSRPVHTPGTRPELDRLRPRALTLTLFVRLALADYFIHGVGGGLYDRVTDRIMADYFRVVPPRYQVVTATHRLPLARPELPGHPARWHLDRARDVEWNPARYLPAPVDAETNAILLERQRLLELSPADTLSKRRRFRALHAVNRELRARVTPSERHHETLAQLARRREASQAVLARRDYSWVLYPEDALPRLLGL